MRSFTDRKLEEATGKRRAIEELRAQCDVLKVVERLAQYKEYEEYYRHIGKLIDSKIGRLVYLEPNEEGGLANFHYECDRLRHEIKTLKLVAEAPKRAGVEVPRIEAKIAELDSEAAAIEQTYGSLSAKGNA